MFDAIQPRMLVYGMIYDLHIHTKPGSGDSYITYKDLVTWAKHTKLDGICITEHGYKKTGVAERLSEEYDFPILEGFEVGTELGDMLVYGVDSVPETVRRATDLRKLVIEEGGMIFAAHPFRFEVTRSIQCGALPSIRLKDVLHYPILGLVDGLEVANGWCIPEDIAFCQVVCDEAGLKGIGGSDAHLSHQIGCCVTVFENSIHSEADLIVELRKGVYYAQDRRNQQIKKPNWWLNNY